MRKIGVGIGWVVLFLLGACSSERNTFTNRAFHNLTSHYNAYYLADTKIKAVENQVVANYTEDYTQVLPVFVPIDSATISSAKLSLDSARELSSKAIDWHRISKWVDDSYYLIGKIDYLQARVDDSKNAFRYVNSQSKDKDLRHRALISLLQLYIDQQAVDDANFTIDYLSKEKDINTDNTFALYKTLAYYYETKGDQNGVIGALDRAVDFTKDKKERSRIYFILAQYYQKEGMDALAFDYYQKSLEGNPPYERAFFATLFAQKVAELNASKDLKKVRNYYEGLYEDPKNKDLKDVVVYEQALFEEKQGNLTDTKKLLHQAAKESGSIPRLKGYIYQKLAELSLQGSTKDYRATKFYLDSALSFIKAEDPVAIALAEQKLTLDTYVFHLDRVEKTDSLLQLATLSTEEQTLRAQDFLAKESKRLAEAASKAAPERSSSIFDNLLAFGDRNSGSSFYFDNSAAMQQGALDFVRTWGNRPLQDNWRRKAALFQSASQAPEARSTSDSTAAGAPQDSLGLPSLESLLAAIPSSPEQRQEAANALEDSYFELGKVLFFDLKETEQSRKYLEKLISSYPKTIKKPEAYYLLYLGQKELQGNPDLYANFLNIEFPESPYTFSVNNPEASTGNLAYLESSKGYEQAYNAYYAGEYAQARALVFATLEKYPLTRNTEKLLLLNAMLSGKLEFKYAFQLKLQEFIKTAQDPALIALAKAMLQPLLSQEELGSNKNADLAVLEPIASPVVEAEKTTTPVLPESPYKAMDDQTHIIVVALNSSEVETAKNLLGDLEAFHTQAFGNARLRTGNMNLSQQLSIYIISPFSNTEKAMTYLTTFQEKFTSDGFGEEAKSRTFFISIENFQVLNRTKNIDEYLHFFTSTYR